MAISLPGYSLARSKGISNSLCGMGVAVGVGVVVGVSVEVELGRAVDVAMGVAEGASTVGAGVGEAQAAIQKSRIATAPMDRTA